MDFSGGVVCCGFPGLRMIAHTFLIFIYLKEKQG